MIKRVHFFQAAMLGAVALTGCNAPMPTSDAPASLDPAVNISSSRYNLLDTAHASAAVATNVATNVAASATVNAAVTTNAELSSVNVTSVSASSVLNDYFRVSYVNDDNVHSAWAPAADDKAPCLTFNLSERVSLTSFGIKMSHADVTVDVAVRDHGEWTTIASGLSPTRTVMDTLTVKTSMCNQVKLTFRGADCASLKVCEVELYANGSEKPVPLPSPRPSAMPSVQPSAMPSAVPSLPVAVPSVPVPMPSASWVPVPVPVPSISLPPIVDCTQFTGGGFVRLGDGRGHNKVSFGFVALVDGDAARGTLEVDDHVNHSRFHCHVRAIHHEGARVVITGSLDDGTTWRAACANNQDLGLGDDEFSFTTSSGYACSGLLGGGQIKFRAKDCQVSREHERELCQDLIAVGIGAEVDAEQTFQINLDDYDSACDRGDFDRAVVASGDDGEHHDRDHQKNDHSDEGNHQQGEHHGD